MLPISQEIQNVIDKIERHINNAKNMMKIFPGDPKNLVSVLEMETTSSFIYRLLYDLSLDKKENKFNKIKDQLEKSIENIIEVTLIGSELEYEASEKLFKFIKMIDTIDDSNKTKTSNLININGLNDGDNDEKKKLKKERQERLKILLKTVDNISVNQKIFKTLPKFARPEERPIPEIRMIEPVDPNTIMKVQKKYDPEKKGWSYIVYRIMIHSLKTLFLGVLLYGANLILTSLFSNTETTNMYTNSSDITEPVIFYQENTFLSENINKQNAILVFDLITDYTKESINRTNFYLKNMYCRSEEIFRDQSFTFEEIQAMTKPIYENTDTFIRNVFSGGGNLTEISNQTLSEIKTTINVTPGATCPIDTKPWFEYNIDMFIESMKNKLPTFEWPDWSISSQISNTKQKTKSDILIDAASRTLERARQKREQMKSIKVTYSINNNNNDDDDDDKRREQEIILRKGIENIFDKLKILYGPLDLTDIDLRKEYLLKKGTDIELLPLEEYEDLIEDISNTGSPHEIMKTYFPSDMILNLYSSMKMGKSLSALGMNNLLYYSRYITSSSNSVLYSFIYSILTIIPDYYIGITLKNYINSIIGEEEGFKGKNATYLFWIWIKKIMKYIWNLTNIRKFLIEEGRYQSIIRNSVPKLGFTIEESEKVFPSLPILLSVSYLYHIEMEDISRGTSKYIFQSRLMEEIESKTK
jgi:hypothetical protein